MLEAFSKFRSQNEVAKLQIVSSLRVKQETTERDGPQNHNCSTLFIST